MCEVVGFWCGAVQVFVLVGYGAVSLGDWCVTFGDLVVILSSRIKCPVDPEEVPHPSRIKMLTHKYII